VACYFVCFFIFFFNCVSREGGLAYLVCLCLLNLCVWYEEGVCCLVCLLVFNFSVVARVTRSHRNQFYFTKQKVLVVRKADIVPNMFVIFP